MHLVLQVQPRKHDPNLDVDCYKKMLTVTCYILIGR